jgi:Mg2+/Co2+ transporter CorC
VKKMTVRDLMVSRDEYITLSDSSTLYEAVMELNQQQKEKGDLAHTTILIKNESGKIVSHLNIFDVMRGIEPKYREVSSLSRFGISDDLVEQIFRDSEPWAYPLDELCSKAPQILIKDIMLEFSRAETIPVDDDLNRAIHKIVVNQLHSLMVVDENKEFAGILRSIDLFNLLRSQVEACKLDKS